MTRAEFLGLLDEITEAKPGTVKGTEQLTELEGWDSLAVVSFIAVVDEHFGVTLSAEKLQKCRSVDDLVSLLPAALNG